MTLKVLTETSCHLTTQAQAFRENQACLVAMDNKLINKG